MYRPKHETKSCARCGAVFECKSGSVLLCQCQTVVLDEAALEYIAARYDDCLCRHCLLVLRDEAWRRRQAARLQAIMRGRGR